jgi:hypothetical protein
MLARLLILWAGWRILRVLIGVGLIVGAFAWFSNELSSHTGLREHPNTIVHQVQHKLAPLIGGAERAINRAIGPAQPAGR